MEIARIDIKDQNGHIIAWYAHGTWRGLTSILPSVVHLIVKSLGKSRQAFDRAVERLDDRA